MNKNEFYMLLPSNSSMHYYPENTASRYTTLLPKQIELSGEWVVGLSEIQFPRNFLHIHNDSEGELIVTSTPEERYILTTLSGEKLLKPEGIALRDRTGPYAQSDPEKKVDPKTEEVLNAKLMLQSSAFLQSAEDIMRLLDHSELQYHFRFEYSPITGFLTITRRCINSDRPSCKDKIHHLKFSDKLWTILGFPTGSHVFGNMIRRSMTGDTPVSLIRGLPDSMYIYSDLCTPYVTGDVQTSLLRSIPINTADYKFGTMHCVTLGSPHYIPLIRSSIRTIEIDIRNHRGELIPFTYGPLTVTLHFKRID